MRSTPNSNAGKAIGWLLVGLTVLPLLAARAEACEPAERAERLAWLLAQHDVRELINMPPVVHAARTATDAEENQR
jgi:hypothetical protein